MQAAQGMEAALSKLLLVVERYPDLKAGQNFLALQAELEGTENRVAVARTRFNEAVRDTVNRLRDVHTDFLFCEFGAGLKVKSYDSPLADTPIESVSIEDKSN